MSTLKVKILLERAKEFQNFSEHDKAISLIIESIKLNPYNVNAITSLAFSQTKIGDFSSAIDTYQKALKLLPNSAEIFFKLACCFLELGEYQEAERNLKKSLKLNSNFLEALEKLADLYYLNKDFERSVNTLQQYLSVDQSNVLIISRLSEIYLEKNDIVSALELLNSFISIHPDTPEFVLGMANCYLKLEKYSEALNTLKHLLNISPQNEQALLLMGHIYKFSGNRQAALGFYKKALSFSEKDPDILSSLAIYYFEAGEYQVAEEYFLTVIKYSSLKTKYQYYFGLNYLKQKNYQQAEVYFQRLVEKEPDNLDALDKLALVYSLAGKTEQAIELAEKLWNITNKTKYLLNLAKLQEKNKNFTNSLINYQFYYQKTENPEQKYLIKMSDLALKVQDPQKALSFLENLADSKQIIDPQFAKQINLIYSKIWHSLNEPEKTIFYLNNLEPDHSLNLTELQEMLKLFMFYGDFSKAAKTNEFILQLNLSESNRIQATNNLAGIYLKLGNPDQVISLLEGVNDSENFNAFFYLGQAFYQKADFAQALVFLSKAKQFAYSSENFSFYYCLSLIENKHFAEARKELENLSNLSTDSYLADYASAHLFEKENNFSKAIHFLKKMIEYFPTEPEVYLKLGKIYLKIKDEKMAEKTFIEGLEKFPKDKELLKELALLKYNQDKNEEACQYFLQSDLKDPDLMFISGICLFKIGKYQNSKDTFSEILKNNEENLEALVFLAKNQCYLTDFSEALKTIEKIMQLSPGNQDALLILGEVYERQQLFSDALWAYQKLAEKVPDHFEAFKRSGDCFFKMNKYDLALKSYDIALIIFPGAYELFLSIGFVYQEKGEIIKAIEFFEKYLQKVPGEAKILGALGNAYYLRGNYSLAKDTLNRYFWLTSEPELSYLMIAGEVQKKMENEQEALEYYLKALEYYPDSYPVLLQIGNIYYEKDDFKQAKKIFSELMTKYPQEDEVKVLYTVTSYTTDSLTEEEKKIYLSATDKDNRYFDPDWLFYQKKWSKKLIFKTKEMLRELF